jgi:hypothetical protein
MTKYRDKNKVVGYGYVGEWCDGTLGWFLPRHMSGGNRKRPEPPQAHPNWSNVGEPSYLCKITIERVTGVRMRRVKDDALAK